MNQESVSDPLSCGVWIGVSCVAGGTWICCIGLRKNFKGKSFTDTLNSDWSNFCSTNGIRCATIAGNLDPWKIVKIGNDSDGVIDSGSVRLDNAEFNALSPATHTDNFALFRMADEETIIRSTYTREIIKRWVMRDELHVASSVNMIFGPSPFDEKILLQIDSGNTSCVAANVYLYDSNGQEKKKYFFPMHYGMHQRLLDLSIFASGGIYLGIVQAYDMNGLVTKYTQKIAKKITPTESLSKRTELLLINSPAIQSNSNSAYFRLMSDEHLGSGIYTQFAYKLDGNPISAYSVLNKEISFSNLTPGRHTLYVNGLRSGAGETEEPIIYSWIIGEPNQLVINNPTISGTKYFRAKKQIVTQGPVLVQSEASVTFSAGEKVKLNPGFHAEQNSRVKVEVRKIL